ncbi:hypothetical protein Drorol1_Dr00021500 [Drosera rotundifolia]
MDPDSFSSNFFRWDPRPSTLTPTSNRFFEAAVAAAAAAAAAAAPPQMSAAAAAGYCARPAQQSQQQQQTGLEELFQSYGIRYYTAAKIAELGFTVRTLMDMKDDELDDMMNSLSQIFRWDLLVGERYGIKAAVRAERRRLEEEEARRRGVHLMSADAHSLDALSQEGLSEEPVVQQEKEAVGSGGGGVTWDMVVLPTHHHQHHRHQMDNVHHDQRFKSKQVMQRQKKGAGAAGRRDQRAVHHVTSNVNNMDEGDEGENELDDMDDQDDDMDQQGPGGMGCSSMMTGERQREHPFIVTEPGEVARGKKNGLDYLFHLYELCRDFLIQVQNIAKERGEKCPTKVTNQVFRYAKKAGATYINKPKMRHYVHCYALHCLDEETSNALRRAFKEKGENVGAWRQACYKPLVALAARQGSWDIDAIFNAHPRLSIWYVPTKLRQLCHAERSAAVVAASSGSVPMVASMACHHLSNF